jgi:uncharacterized membrane protein
MVAEKIKDVGHKVFLNGYTFLILLVIGILISIFGQNQIKGFLNKQNLLPKDESFTELYINNHTDLPMFLPADTVATASFTIRNNEYQKQTYSYEVRRTQTQREVIDKGSVELNHNDSKSIPFEFTVSTTEAKTRFEIEIPEKTQIIHFWVNNK